MSPLLDDLAAVDDKDDIGPAHGGQAVRDHDRGLPFL